MGTWVGYAALPRSDYGLLPTKRGEETGENCPGATPGLVRAFPRTHRCEDVPGMLRKAGQAIRAGKCHPSS